MTEIYQNRPGFVDDVITLGVFLGSQFQLPFYNSKVYIDSLLYPLYSSY